MQRPHALTPTRAVSNQILDDLARERGDSPIDFERPLYSVIDPDALNALFAANGQHGSVTFEYVGYRITATSNGEVTVRPVDP